MKSKSLTCVRRGFIMRCVVSTGRGALLLPGKVKRLPRVLGGPLHLPGPVVRMTARLDSCHDPCVLQSNTHLDFSRSGTFSDGFFSYGIEPVYNGSTQVTGFYC